MSGKLQETDIKAHYLTLNTKVQIVIKKTTPQVIKCPSRDAPERPQNNQVCLVENFL